MSFLHLMSDALPEREGSVHVERTALAPSFQARPALHPSTDLPNITAPASSTVTLSATSERGDADPSEPKLSPKETQRQLMARLAKINLKGPLKGQDLDDLDAFYELVGSYVEPGELQAMLKKNPQDIADLKGLIQEKEADKWAAGKESVEFDRRERELTDSLNSVDLKAPLANNDLQKLWELQDLYGFDLTPEQMKRVLDQKPANVDEFIEIASDEEDY
jgi:hypothetical protein